MNRKTLLIALSMLVIGFGLAFLVPGDWIYSEPAPMENQDSEGAGWACPMFCVVMDQKPEDEKCPVCGMELGLVSKESALAKHEQAMIGLVPYSLERIPLVREFILYGEVTWDPNRVETVSARSAGWIERLAKRVPLEEIVAGDILYEIYSPDLYEAQQELISSRTRLELKDASRERLALLGLDEKEVEAISQFAAPQRRLPRRAPRSGVIAELSVDEGAHVGRGQKIFGIADPTVVWIQLEAFESDMGWLAPGTHIDLRDESLGKDSVRGKVVFVDPVVNRMSRTARVRVEIANRRRPDGRWALLPGQRVQAKARIALGEDGRPAKGTSDPTPLLAIPRSAVLRTGLRNVVYVLYDQSLKDPFAFDAASLPGSVGYVMVEIEVGPLAQHAGQTAREEYFPLRRVVLGGDPLAPGRLRAGMVVAGEGAFLIDSQAQLSGRPSLYHPEGRKGPAPTGHENH